jgi:dTDP-4-amino-4,6-dideoxygalactose transaminase
MTSPDLPALLGGFPLRPAGPPDWPGPNDAVRDALLVAIADGSWGKYGPRHVDALQARLVALTGQSHALTCASGTFAVELALRSVPVRPGDEVILAGYDYPGNFLCVHAVGARPVLVDVEPDGWQLDAGRLADAVTPETRAVIVSHLHGGQVDMARVMDVCRGRGVAVIEDAAQCPGATVQGKPAGGWGDLGVWSFGGSKLLTSGRGGALLASRPDLHQRARLVLGRGNNLVAPLSELQAAALIPQLDALPRLHSRRARGVEFLRERLRDIPGLRLLRHTGSPGFYKLGMQFDDSTFGVTRKVLTAAMRAEGVALDEGFRASNVGRSPDRWRAAGGLERTMQAHAGMLILHHPILLGDEADLEQIARAFERIRRHAGRLMAGV